MVGGECIEEGRAERRCVEMKKGGSRFRVKGEVVSMKRGIESKRERFGKEVSLC